MTIFLKKALTVILFGLGPLFCMPANGQVPKGKMSFIVSMPEPRTHYYQVEMRVENILRDTLIFKMPEWMPGYYQIMHYAANVENFQALDKSGKELKSQKSGASEWLVVSRRSPVVTLRYAVKAATSFVAACYLDEEHAY